MQVGIFSFMFGAVYGGLRQGQQAYTQFMENNTATTFNTHLEAKVSRYLFHWLHYFMKK